VNAHTVATRRIEQPKDTGPFARTLDAKAKQTFNNEMLANSSAVEPLEDRVADLLQSAR
jgi:hypothetical protein